MRPLLHVSQECGECHFAGAFCQVPQLAGLAACQDCQEQGEVLLIIHAIVSQYLPGGQVTSWPVVWGV